MDITTENWKDISNYDGLYIISTTGKVKNKKTEKEIKPFISENGYMKVGLSKLGKKKHHKVHRLILSTFLHESDLTVDHINGIKTDNRIENLEYVTALENLRRRYGGIQTSNIHGVSFDRIKNMWRVRFSKDKKKQHFGWRKTEEEAINLRNSIM